MKIKNTLLIIFLFLFIEACHSETNNIFKNNSKIYYSMSEYKKIHKKDLLRENDPSYFGLTLSQLNLLNNKFEKATKTEIEDDIAYNRKSFFCNKRYNNIQQFIKNKQNLKAIVNHLGYEILDLKYIIFNKNRAIISFLHQTSQNFSNEIFLINIQNKIINIKLIAYVIT